MVASYLSMHHMIGFSNSLGDYDVDRGHTNVSLFVRIFILQYVRHFLPPPILLMLTVPGQRHGSSQKTLPTSSRTASESDATSTAYSQDSGSNMDKKTLGS